MVTLCLIPKSADNYFNRIDRSFGFDSATEEACRAINTADVEANSFKPGIGIV
jgi:6-phosphofructokinase 1